MSEMDDQTEMSDQIESSSNIPMSETEDGTETEDETETDDQTEMADQNTTIDAFKAVRDNDYLTVIRLIKKLKKNDRSVKNRNGLTLFHLASSLGRLSICESFLFRKFFAVDVLDDLGETALHKAAQSNQKEVVYCLLKYNANPSISNPQSITPLFHAVKHDNLEMVDALVSKGGSGSVNKVSHSGSPLSAAKSEAMIHRLIRDYGCKTDIMVKCMSPLGNFIFYGEYDLARILLEHGADPNQFSDQSFIQSLEMAVYKDKPELVCLLVKHGANTNQKNYAGFKPIEIAALFKRINIIDILLRCTGPTIKNWSVDGLLKHMEELPTRTHMLGIHFLIEQTDLGRLAQSQSRFYDALVAYYKVVQNLMMLPVRTRGDFFVMVCTCWMSLSEYELARSEAYFFMEYLVFHLGDCSLREIKDRVLYDNITQLLIVIAAASVSLKDYSTAKNILGLAFELNPSRVEISYLCSMVERADKARP